MRNQYTTRQSQRVEETITTSSIVRSSTPQLRYQETRSSEILSSPRESTREITMRQLTPKVVEFLMAVEIERLRNENDKLRFRIKEIDDRKFDVQSYEQQIKELNDKLLEQEVQYTYEREEYISRTTILEQQVRDRRQYELYEQRNQELSNEIENLRIKLMNFEEQKLNEFQTIREQIEYEHKLQMEKYAFDYDSTQQYQREFLETELRKWKEMNHQKQKENDDLIVILSQKEQNSQRQRDQENQLIGLKADNDRLNKNLTVKLEETEAWKQKYLHLHQMNDEFDRLEEDNQILKQNIIELEQRNHQLQDTILNYQQEIEKMRTILKNKTVEYEEYKTKSYRNEKTIQEYLIEKKQFNDKAITLQQEIDRLGHIIRQKNLELENIQKVVQEQDRQFKQFQGDQARIIELEIRLKECEQKLQEYETRYKNLLQEVNRLNQVSKDKDELIITYTSQLKTLEYSIEQYNSQIDESSDEISQLQQKIKELQNQVQYLMKYEENIRVLSSEIDRLTDECRIQEGELKQWRLKYADDGSSFKTIQDVLCQMVVLICEVESLRQRNLEKDVEIEEIRRMSIAQFRLQ